MASNRSRQVKPRAKTINIYLIAFNLVSAASWAYLLVQLSQHILPPSKSFLDFFRSKPSIYRHRAETAYSSVGQTVTIVQTLAVLEPLHIALGIVRSSFGTTLAQVFSRLFVVYGTLLLFPETQTCPFFASMLVAWCITEVIRYTNYAGALVGIKLKPLEWLRYTLFYILYPIGAGSEAVHIYRAAPLASKRYGRPAELTYLAMSCVIWPASLLFLTSYMHGQRRKQYVTSLLKANAA